MTDAVKIECDLQVRFTYSIYFTRGVFRPQNSLLGDLLSKSAGSYPEKVLVYIEEAISQQQPELRGLIRDYFSQFEKLTLVEEPILLAGGEELKNSPASIAQMHQLIERSNLSRHSFIIAVGGGALLDTVGFAAATAHRGMRHIRLPTTTLSQADGGVGVKNGINAFGKKNFIGCFAPPLAVVNDVDFLESLTDRRKRDGYAEAVKVSLIRDSGFFERIRELASQLSRFDAAAMEEVIRRSAELHVRHISTGGDPFEWGSARPLDFGHWSAHKLEQLSGFWISHGEAVAIGVALDVVYSRQANYLSDAEAERVLDLLERLGFTLFADELTQMNSQGELVLLQGLQEFQQHLGGRLTITLLQGIGQGFEVHEMDPRLVRSAIDELRMRSGQVSGS